MEAQEGKEIIVGVDPGTTVGIAILDFDGRILLVKSKKEWGLDKVIYEISRWGSPAVIATDKAEVPEFVRKIASNFGAVIFSPDEDISVEEKKEIARKYEIVDAHQRDALSAAINAYKKLKPRILKAKRLVKEKENELIGQLLKTGILDLQEKQKRETDEVKALKKDLEKSKRIIKDLRRKLKSEKKIVISKQITVAKAEIDTLRTRVKKLERELREKEEELDKVERLLNQFVNGDVDVYYKKTPPDHIIIYKLGDVYFTREKSRHSEMDGDKLEKLLEEYRKTKMKKLREDS